MNTFTKKAPVPPYVADQKALFRGSPAGYIPHWAWPEFDLPHVLPKMFHARLKENVMGSEWVVGPFFFEEYITDDEPTEKNNGPLAKNRLRVTIWQRKTRFDNPRGWLKGLTVFKSVTSFSETEGEYASRWSESARRSRRVWLRLAQEGRYAIEEVSWETLKRAYVQTKVGRKYGEMFIHSAERRIGDGHENFSHFAVRNRSSTELVAGMTVINSPTYKSSYYHLGFYIPGTEKLPLMLGLFDHWYKTSQENGISYLHFGNMWMPGNPSSWKGFSSFKSKFNPTLVSLPSRLYKFWF